MRAKKYFSSLSFSGPLGYFNFHSTVDGFVYTVALLRPIFNFLLASNCLIGCRRSVISSVCASHRLLGSECTE